MTHDHTAIREYIDDVERALQAGALYAALALALALPDICATMHLRKDGEKTGMRHYVNWCRKYMRLFQNRRRNRRVLRPTHVYALRCAFLHNGTALIGSRHDRSRGLLRGLHLIWEGPEPHGSVIFTISTRGFTRRRDLAAQIDVGVLCRSITAAVSSWFAATRTNRVVQRNLGSLLRIEDRQQWRWGTNSPIQPAQASDQSTGT